MFQTYYCTSKTTPFSGAPDTGEISKKGGCHEGVQDFSGVFFGFFACDDFRKQDNLLGVLFDPVNPVTGIDQLHRLPDEFGKLEYEKVSCGYERRLRNNNISFIFWFHDANPGVEIRKVIGRDLGVVVKIGRG